MGTKTEISWTDATWNPVRGCSIVSPGCANCYAMNVSHRFSGPGQPYEGLTKKTSSGPKWTGTLRLMTDALALPAGWKKPRRIFVNSMSDLFHPGVPDEFIDRVFAVMKTESRHTFQVLTKRPERMRAYCHVRAVPGNVWLGVSVEDFNRVWRVYTLQGTDCPHRFVSFEPLLGPLGDVDLDGIDWVIVGGESGPGARAMHLDWVRDIRDECTESEILFHFKQWGGAKKSKHGRELDGREWLGMPAV